MCRAALLFGKGIAHELFFSFFHCTVQSESTTYFDYICDKQIYYGE